MAAVAVPPQVCLVAEWNSRSWIGNSGVRDIAMGAVVCGRNEVCALLPPPRCGRGRCGGGPPCVWHQPCLGPKGGTEDPDIMGGLDPPPPPLLFTLL